MAVEWYCQLMGSELGPLNVEQLVEMVRQHQITPEDLVRRNKSPWVPAYQVKGLFEAAAKPKPKPKAEPEPSASEGASQRVQRGDDDAVQDVAASSPAMETSGTVVHGSDVDGLPQDDWYCIASGEKQGPLSFNQLQALANNGKLRDRDRVWRGSAPKWHRASEVKGLELPASR